MKAPLWFPQSFFSRTLWLVLIVVLFSKALTLVYLMMNEDVLVDRNPQKFVDIYHATEADFQKATHRVYRSARMGSHLMVGVLK